MQIVIKISDTLKKIIDSHDIQTASHPMWVATMIDAIENGTPLPKGHGDLIDVNDIRVIELEDSLHIVRHEKGDEIDVYIDAPTIIEADTVSEGEE